jgi:hypothetical protein
MAAEPVSSGRNSVKIFHLPNKKNRKSKDKKPKKAKLPVHLTEYRTMQQHAFFN